MEIRPTALPDVIELQPAVHGDHRGWFSEAYNARAFADAGLPTAWMQDNESLSGAKGTVRGLHYQIAPHPQDKLVRVLHGSILDVAVDLRRSSVTFGQHVTVELSAQRRNQLLIPAGFGHGFCTLVADSVVAYKVSGTYSPESERGIRWNDPALGIDWPVAEADAVISAKDQVTPLLGDAVDLFD